MPGLLPFRRTSSGAIAVDRSAVISAAFLVPEFVVPVAPVIRLGGPPANQFVVGDDLGISTEHGFDEVGGGFLVGGQACGRRPQGMPNNLHCLLRLCGGGSAGPSDDVEDGWSVAGSGA